MEKELPKGWCEALVENLAIPIRGVTYSKGDAFSEPFENSIFLIRGGNIQDGKIVRSEDKVFISKSLIKQSQILKQGDVIVVSSTGSSKLIGKAAIAPKDEIEISFGAFITLLRPNKIIHTPFFGYYFQTSLYRDKIRELSGGVNINNIRNEHILGLSIKLPPLNEQKRIAEKLDAIFGHLDNVEKKMEVFLKWESKFVESSLVNSSSNSFYKRENLGKYLEEGNERIGSNWFGIKKVGVSAEKGIIELSTGAKQTFEKYKIVRPGDFVYNAMRVNIGSIALYEGEEIAITSPDYVVFRVKHTLSPRLLLRFLKSEKGLLEIGVNTQGSVRSRLYFNSLSSVRFPIAPAAIQIQAETFLKLSTGVKSKFNDILNGRIFELKQSILSKAFRGELVPQDPADEPASELLKRIRQEKDAGKKSNPKTIKKKNLTMTV